MDQVERANFEHLAVTCRLPNGLSDFSQQWQFYELSDVLPCPFRLPFVVRPLTLNQMQN